MKEQLETFLNQRLPLPGIAAWAASLPDRSILSHCYTDWFSTEQVEQLLSRLVLAANGMGYHDIQVVRLCWVFEHARIHFALGSQGACLALFVENRPGVMSAELESVLAGFTRLAPG
jgi:hypothetical protein